MLVASTRAGKQAIDHVCPRAHAAGVRPGMSLAHGRALACARSKEVRVLPHEPDRDAAGLAALSRACLRWSPLVRAEPPDAVVLDITGCEHLFGGEQGLAEAVHAWLARLAITARIGIASSVGAAWALAHFGHGEIAAIPRGGECQALSPLPVAALRIEPQAAAALGEVGITTVGELLAVTRTSLPGRYGAPLLRRVDQALGLIAEPVDGPREEEPARRSTEIFAGTTRWEDIAEITRRMLAELIADLRRREAVIARLDAHFARIDAPPVTIIVEVTRPTRAHSHLWSLLRPRLERLHMGHGVERIELHAAKLGRIAHAQRGLAGIDDDRSREGSEAELARMLETMAARLGPHRLHRPSPRASHRPERAFALEPGLAARFSAAAGPSPPPPARARPTVLLETPEPARAIALAPEGPLLRLWWRGEERSIAACIGPERIAGEWWLAREPSRDYFRIQDGRGTWLWVFRESSGAWLVHGVWA